MQSITPVLRTSSATPLYLQLYTYIRDAILSGRIQPGEKLPSLRSLSGQLGLSLSTVEQAYTQLSVEGYLNSKPQSGYYANSIPVELRQELRKPFEHSGEQNGEVENPGRYSLMELGDQSDDALYFDPITFDFAKWKKCLNQILNDHAPLLYQEGDPRGEAPLRYEISKYIYQARGVLSTPEQIVIGAGTQQLTGLLCILLARMGIDHVSLEEPGYLPVRDIFRTHNFKMTPVPVREDGIEIERLPVNIKSSAYVSPSNQFPTGSVMPIARRYALLDWASKNQSIIIEDDYNSELRYFGKPVPSLQGLDEDQQVVYLGSFSSTLFPAIKISYMVLPAPMLDLFAEELSGYTQTCSKTEQLTLALYMERGFYQTGVRKLRNLYSQKLQAAASALRRCFGRQIRILGSNSGLQLPLTLNLPDHLTPETFCTLARRARLQFASVSNYLSAGSGNAFIFYYTRVPLSEMDTAIERLAQLLG